MSRLVRSGSSEQLAARHRFISYEDIASASPLKKTSPFKVEIVLHDGRKVVLRQRLTGFMLTRDSVKRLFGLLLAQPAAVLSTQNAMLARQ